MTAQTQNSVEKIYTKIDEDLGEDHVQAVVQNLVNIEDGPGAYENLMKLHQQCCTVFSKYPNQPSREEKGSTKLKKTPLKK